MSEHSLFLAVLDIDDPSERSAYLDRACAGDPALRAQVEQLLKAHQESGLFMESPALALGVTVDDPVRERPGTTIGPYKLLEEIGEGGMGLVFVAEQQQPIKRRVALKIIKPGMDSRQVIARFEAERQALAMMDHPHIAKVHDGGTTPEGRPYFVMELVKGTPITDYCDSHRLTTRQRLQLFLDVCSAVQHAHQKGIIHRDLKPSNVLVSHHDVTPVVKVIDFGIAKATSGRLTDKTLYTAFAQMVGTPLYMSPEQAGLSDLDVDTRSDVYSLGVLMYELLTGTTPFDSETLKRASYDEIRRVIREDEPPRPSTRLSTMQQAALSTIAEKRGLEQRRLSQQLCGELDWIVMKALEKDRGRRYETANGFARDIERYLADEPVLACPPSAGYRFRKFARKNRTVLATACAFVLMLAAAVVVSTWQAILARQAETKAQQALTLAEERFDLAKQAVDKYLNEVTEDPELKGSNFETLRKKLLETAVPFYQKLAEQAPGDPEREAARGRAYGRLAAIRRELGDFAASLADYQKMHATFAPLAEAFPAEPAYRRDQGRSLVGQGEILYSTGRADDAESAYRAALAIGQQLVNDFPSNPEYHSDLGKIHHGLAGLLGIGLRTMADAEAEARAALKELQRLVEEYPNNLDYRHELAKSHNTLGTFLSYQGKEAESEAEYRVALKEQQRLLDEHPNVPIYRQLLAGILDNLGEHRAALKELERLVGEHANVSDYRHELAASHHNLGDQLAKHGKLADAEREYRAALKDRQLVAGESASTHYRWGLAHDHLALAHVLAKQGKPVEAEKELRNALVIKEKMSNEDEAESHYALGDFYVLQNKHATALSEFNRAIELDSKIELQSKIKWQQDHWYHLRYRRRGKAHFYLKHYEQALADIAKAVELRPDDLGNLTWIPREDVASCPDEKFRTGMFALADNTIQILESKPNVSNAAKMSAYYIHASMYQASGKKSEAEAEYRTAFKIGQRMAGEHPNDPKARNYLAKIHNHMAWWLATCPQLELRDPGQAVAHAKKVVELVPNNGNAWNTLGVAQYRNGDWKAAIEALMKSVQLSEGGSSFDFFFLAMAHWQLNDKDKARAWYDQAVAWMDKNDPQNEELKRFRAEATALLGLAKAAETQKKKK